METSKNNIKRKNFFLYKRLFVIFFALCVFAGLLYVTTFYPKASAYGSGSTPSSQLMLQFSSSATKEQMEEFFGSIKAEVLKSDSESKTFLINTKSELKTGKLEGNDLINSAEKINTKPAKVLRKLISGPAVSQDVRESIMEKQNANVIVSFFDPLRKNASKNLRKFAINSLQEDTFKHLTGQKLENTRIYDQVPAFSSMINQKDLEYLENDPMVESIRLNRAISVNSAESKPLTKTDIVHGLPFELRGEGMTVAVIDTGIDTDHPDFTADGAIVDQKCFTSYIYDEQVPPQVIWEADCQGTDPTEGVIAEDYHGHGTNVAGIITAPEGFAPDAEIVPIKVTNEAGIGIESDWLRALDWIISTQEELQVDVINISMEVQEADGSGLFFDNHNVCDAQFPEVKNAIGHLNTLGVIVFAGTGNRGNRDGISAPACLSNVVAVGATYDSDMGREPDEGTYYDPYPGSGHLFTSWGECFDAATSAKKVACFTNTSSQLSNIIMAPGSKLTSSGLGGGTSTQYGTSQATPVAAGIGTLLLQLDKSLTTGNVITILQNSGSTVFNDQNDPFSFINAEQAINSLVTSECQSVSDIPAKECIALKRLYEDTDGINWTNNTGWLGSATACTWYGLTCSDGHVTGINLPNNNLSGKIAQELGNLGYLATLDLSRNSLSGTIPKRLYTLSSLTSFKLDQNSLTGIISSNIGNLVNLTILDFSRNNLSGSLPAEAGNLTPLEVMNLSENELSGDVPPEIVNLANLNTLNLSRNKLSGEIPSGIGTLGDMMYLYLDNNQFDGEISDLICNNGGYTALNLDYNKLLDSDYSCTVYFSWPSTQTIAPSGFNAAMSGDDTMFLTWTAIPYTADNGYYEIAYSLTSGGLYMKSVKTSSKSSTSVTINDLLSATTYYFVIRSFTPAHAGQSNNLYSDFSLEVSGMTTDSMSQSKCTGITELPESQCRALEHLYNNTNGAEWTNNVNNINSWFNNTSPCSWYGVVCVGGYLIELRLDKNNLAGTLPPELGYLEYLQVLDLQYNNLGGSIPSELGYLSALYSLNLSVNNLGGNIPSSFGTLYSLHYLNLGFNEIQGAIPPDLGELEHARGIDLQWNNLSGSIPEELANLTKLEYLYLNNNNLAGEMPSELGDLSFLEELVLETNNLSGEIPAEIGSIVPMQTLNLSHNNLSGSIPEELTNLAQLENLNLHDNNLTGEITPYFGNLSALEQLWLCSNNLSGNIPAELGNLSNLQKLCLGTNSFSGSIPAQLGNLFNLDLLLLNDNKLSGQIPLGLCTSSDFASGIDFDYNMLLGTDPCINGLLGSNWQEKQIFSPTDLQVTSTLNTRIDFSWTPIPYETSPGYFETYDIGYSLVSGGPFIPVVSTTIQHQSSIYIDGLLQDTPYYFAIRASTPAHDSQKNELISEFSSGIPGTTTGSTFCSGVTQIPGEECRTLHILYNKTGGPAWTNKSGWLVDTSPCIWHGVMCSSGKVVSLELPNNNLTGDIPGEISYLGSLTILDLSSNNLAGAIPSQYSSLINLEQLILHGNQLSGSLPSEIGNINSLQKLWLHSNQLDGILPDGLANLTNLVSLDLHNNALSGEIPSGLAGLENLSGAVPTPVDFGYNKLLSTTPSVMSFLYEKDPDWDLTQTVPPTNIKFNSINSTTVQVEFLPINYQTDGGYYQVNYSETPGGPYNNPGCTTSDKSDTSCTVGGLEQGLTYYFAAKTYTPPHGEQQNDLTSEFGEESSSTVGENSSPALSILEPNGIDDVADISYTIVWDDSDPDDTASINLFYDNNNFGLDGIQIQDCGPIVEDNGTDSCVWDVSGLAEGDYYVYGVIQDATNVPVTDYSDGIIKINHTNTPPVIRLSEPNGIDDLADTSYNITWLDSDTDDNASITLYYDTNNSGYDGTKIADCDPILENDISDLCTWNTITVAGGDYYIYSVISDGTNREVKDYSDGPVTINHAPAITILEPDGVDDIASTGTFNITWTDNDPDNNALITLYYDTDSFGYDGKRIVDCDPLYEDETANSCNWNVSAAEERNYYVYAIIDDGVNPSISVYSSGPVTVNNGVNDPPSIQITEPERTGRLVDTEHYITWEASDVDSNATISLYYDIDASGNDGLLITDALTENETDSYLWDTSFLPEGTYYLYAEISDGTGPSTFAYREEPVIIDHTYSNHCAQISEIQLYTCFGLAELFLQADGNSWWNNSGWFEPSNYGPCSTQWHGIVCSAEQIISIELPGNDLDGDIPFAISRITSLQVLDLSGNVNGISGRKLNGIIPASLGNLSNLTVLHLYNNELRGPIPPELGSLGSLYELNIEKNSLSGSIPAEIGLLNNLYVLRLGENLLTGGIPYQIGTMPNLAILDLHNNNLSESLPTSIGNMINLQELMINDNQIDGIIPPNLGNLSSLQVLWAYNNQLTGSIPQSIGDLHNLRELLLYNNNLTGSIPPDLGDTGMVHLYAILLQKNHLSGSIPTTLGNLQGLTSLNLSQNSLEGNIPLQLGNLGAIRTLSLNDNYLTGSIPAEFDNLINLLQLNLYNNNLSGSIPDLSSSSNLQVLSLQNNSLSGGVPQWIGAIDTLKRINLGSNDLGGPIPFELGSIGASLIELNLHGNRLEGSIPAEFNNLSNLKDLRLHSNYLGGNIPAGLSSMSTLELLYLSGNRLEGSIPSTLGQLECLEILDLGENKLSGNIPAEIENMGSKVNDGVNCLNVIGNIPGESRGLHLQANKLKGEIPIEITSLTLDKLDIGYNMLESSNLSVQSYLNGYTDAQGRYWYETQTIPPKNVTIEYGRHDNRYVINWDPIIYRLNAGHYEVLHSATPGGPYGGSGSLVCTTKTKYDDSCVTDQLPPGVNYYFKVRTFTPYHNEQQSDLQSDLGEEISGIIAADTNGLISAIDYANSSGSSTNIYLYPNSYYSIEQVNNVINGDTGLPVITGDITITGKNTKIEREVLSGNTPDMRIFNISSTGQLTLNNLKVRHGSIDGDKGGGIRNEGTLFFNDTTFSQHIALAGGAVYNLGTITAANSTIESNMAFGYGGGIENAPGSLLNMTGGAVKSNTAGSGGGGINNQGTATLDEVEITNNFAASGGGLRNGGSADLGSVVLTNNSTMDPNLANGSGTGNCDHNDPYKGGGICNYGTISVVDSMLQSNSSINFGGGFYNSIAAGSTNINNSCILGNAATTNDEIRNDSATSLDATGNWWGYTSVPTPPGAIGGNVDYSGYLETPVNDCDSGILHDELSKVKPYQALPYIDNEYIDTSLQPLGDLAPSCGGSGITKGIYYGLSDDEEFVSNVIGRSRIGGTIGRARIGGTIGRAGIGGLLGNPGIGSFLGRNKYRLNVQGEDFTPVLSLFKENGSVMEEVSCETGAGYSTVMDILIDPGVNHYMVIGFTGTDDGTFQFHSESLQNPLPVEVTGYELNEILGSPEDDFYLNVEVLNVRDYNLADLDFRLYIDEDDTVYSSADKAIVVSSSASISSILQGETSIINDQLGIQFTENYTPGDTVKFYLEISEEVTTGSYTRTVVSTIPLIIPRKLKFESWDFDDEQEITSLPEFPPTSDPRYMDAEFAGLEEYAVRWIEDVNFPYNEYYSIAHERGGELSEQFYDRMAGKLSGYFQAESTGTYEFYLTVQDGARLIINGAIVIDDTGPRIMDDGSVMGSISLTEGLHSIEIQYFEDMGGNGLKLEYQDPVMTMPEVIPPRLFIYNVPPELQFIEPNGSGDLAENDYTLMWTDSDPEDNASISLYYDTDNAGADGVLITSGISENDPANSFVWDTSIVAERGYYIYAVISDGINSPVTKYSSYPVVVNRHGICPLNLCNGDFESTIDLEYWVSGNGTNQIVSDVVQDGVAAYYSEHTYDTGVNPRWSGIWQTVLVESAQTYGLTGFYQSENAAQGHIKISWKDISGAVLQVDYPVINMSGTNSSWIEFSKLIIAPAGAVTAEIKIWHGVNASAQNVLGSKLWIDSLLFDAATTSCGTLCNESFEHGILYWIQSGAAGSHSIVFSDPHEGLKILKSEQLYTSGDLAKWAGVTQFAQVKEGTTYRLRLWLKALNAANGHVRIRWRDIGGNLLSTEYPPIGGISGNILKWTKKESTITAPVNAAKAEIAIWHGVTGGTINVPGSTLWVDDITMICQSLCNGGFEDGNVHWETNGRNEGEIITTGVQEGSQAIKIVQNLGAGDITQWAGISQRTLVIGGSNYNLSFWVKKENAVQGHVKVKWRGQSDQVVLQQFPITGITGTNPYWTQLSTTLLAPATAETVEIFIWHGVNSSNQNATGSTLYLDNISFSQ